MDRITVMSRGRQLAYWTRTTGWMAYQADHASRAYPVPAARILTAIGALTRLLARIRKEDA